jgi:hypothetical protein
MACWQRSDGRSSKYSRCGAQGTCHALRRRQRIAGRRWSDVSTATRTAYPRCASSTDPCLINLRRRCRLFDRRDERKWRTQTHTLSPLPFNRHFFRTQRAAGKGEANRRLLHAAAQMYTTRVFPFLMSFFLSALSSTFVSSWHIFLKLHFHFLCTPFFFPALWCCVGVFTSYSPTPTVAVSPTSLRLRKRKERKTE